MDLLKDYDCKILYHSSKDNVVANALSQKKSAILAQLMSFSWKLVDVMQMLCLN